MMEALENEVYCLLMGIHSLIVLLRVLRASLDLPDRRHKYLSNSLDEACKCNLDFHVIFA